LRIAFHLEWEPWGGGQGLINRHCRREEVAASSCPGLLREEMQRPYLVKSVAAGRR
jgi:hypothetical protein